MFLTISCLYSGTQPKKVLPRSVTVTEKCAFFFRPTFLIYRFREGVQEGYVRKEFIVDALVIFFLFILFRNSLYPPWPLHQQSSARWGNSRRYFLSFIFLQIQFQYNLLKFWVNFSKFEKNANWKSRENLKEVLGKFYFKFLIEFFSRR